MRMLESPVVLIEMPELLSPYRSRSASMITDDATLSLNSVASSIRSLPAAGLVSAAFSIRSPVRMRDAPVEKPVILISAACVVTLKLVPVRTSIP